MSYLDLDRRYIQKKDPKTMQKRKYVITSFLERFSSIQG